MGPEDTELDVRKLLADIVANVGGDVRVDQYQSSLRALQAVDQRLAGQVVVDEGGLCADGPEGHKQEHELGRILEV